jgi:hypothetical protein
MQAQKSSLRFSLNVPGKGQVEGILHYFPFENASESLPIEDFNLVHNPITNYNMTQPQQGIAYTQAPPTTQATTQAMKGKQTSPPTESHPSSDLMDCDMIPHSLAKAVMLTGIGGGRPYFQASCLRMHCQWAK